MTAGPVDVSEDITIIISQLRRWKP